jgi:hypothetical protein
VVGLFERAVLVVKYLISSPPGVMSAKRTSSILRWGQELSSTDEVVRYRSEEGVQSGGWSDGIPPCSELEFWGISRVSAAIFAQWLAAVSFPHWSVLGKGVCSPHSIDPIKALSDFINS